MIELPEAAVLAEQVNSVLKGKRILNVIANQSPHKFAWFTGNPQEYHHRLADKTIRGATACAGLVEIQVDDMLLVIGAPMFYHLEGEKLPAKHQLLVEFDDFTALTVTVQMWGGIFCFKAGEPGGFIDYELGKQRPSPLSEAFTRAYFDSLFTDETGKLSAKEFLATKQRIPGLGNGVLQDILWKAKIHPRRKMAQLTEDDLHALYTAVKTVPRAMTLQGGRDTERDLFGCPGGYRTVLSKNTVGAPCPACGALIKKESFLGGSIYYCPGCQPM